MENQEFLHGKPQDAAVNEPRPTVDPATDDDSVPVAATETIEPLNPNPPLPEEEETDPYDDEYDFFLRPYPRPESFLD